jgi:hypothetical protein
VGRLLLLLLLPALFHGPGLLHRLRGLRIPLSQLLKNGPHSSRHALVESLVQERPGTCRRRWLRLLQLSDQPARLIKDIGRGRVLRCFGLGGVLRGAGRLLRVRLLGRPRGLRDPLR